MGVKRKATENAPDSLAVMTAAMVVAVVDDDSEDELDVEIDVDIVAAIEGSGETEMREVVIEPLPEDDVEPVAPTPIALKEIEVESVDADSMDAAVEVDEEAIDDPVRMYLREISRVKLLKADQEVQLAKRMEKAVDAREKLLGLADLPDAFREKLTEQLERGRRPDLIETWAHRLPPDFRELLDLVDDGRRAHSGLTEANLRLVVSIAKKYMGRGLSLLDLIQEGNIGLTRAVDKFDYKMGYKFSTYATWWVRQAITRAIADQARTIRIPVHMVETINNLYRATRRLVQELAREPTDEEIAREMTEMAKKPGEETSTVYTPEKVREIKKAAQQPVSLETPVGEEEDSHLGDFIPDNGVQAPIDHASRQLLKEQVDDVLDSLAPRERKVLRLRFGLESGGRSRTLEEVGAELGVTRERIRQIEAKALRKLRHPSRSKKLKDYLE